MKRFQLTYSKQNGSTTKFNFFCKANTAHIYHIFALQTGLWYKQKTGDFGRATNFENKLFSNNGEEQMASTIRQQFQTC